MTASLRHQPMRRCVACRAESPKRALIRLWQDESGWQLDLRQRAGGRGTSLCPGCALAAVRQDDAGRLKGFRRAFKQDADAVRALLTPLTDTLAVAAFPTSTGHDNPRPHPNGGMHG